MLHSIPKVKRKALQTDAEALSAAADEFRSSRGFAATNTSGKSKRYVTSSKRESRATEGTEPAYRQ